MHDSPGHYSTGRARSAVHRLVRGIRRRRRAAIGLLLRGACYGLGAGAVSGAAYWLQSRM
ncbi:hypothetical protein ACFYW6_31340 [Streptomyces sp. NPDC002659]|uniref:hypothetical protein n=1 Tax=Streptomyces sp. NPDC002659 TaxID=3364656 RepID=UPI00369FDCB2